MAQRIRYVEEDSGIFRSRKIFTSASTGARYKVLLDTNEMIFKIQNLNTMKFVYTGGQNINNMNVLKRTAKKTLEKKFGVNFDEETRNRTYGRCPKNWSQEKEIAKRLRESKELKPNG
ncbi:MAG: hypothetical protein HRU26_07480 [Psychroserpens sp.]|nr:hypothetical protein [Psychroserpens sp.]